MRQCSTCAGPIHKRNKSGLCITCFSTDPAWKAKRTAALRLAYQLNPGIGIAARDRIVAATQTPEHAERARKMMTENRLWERGIEVCGPKGSPSRQRAGKAVSAHRLRHIPAEQRDEYRRIRQSFDFSPEEAARIVIEDHEHKMARFRRKLIQASG